MRRRSGAATRPASRAAAPRYDFVGVLDRLLRGPAYIAVIGVLLAGIVFFNVDVLELNHGIARTDTRASQLKRENAGLTLKLAKLGSSERIQRLALQRGLVLPQPGDVRYLRADRDDAGRALRVMTAPDSSTGAPVVPAVVMQSGESVPTSTTTTAPTTVATTQTTPTQATATPTTEQTTAPTQTTPAPTTTAQPAPAAQPTPAPTTEAGAVAAPATP